MISSQGGETSCGLIINFKCRKHRCIFGTCKFPFVGLCVYYKPEYTVKVITEIYLDPGNIAGSDIQGVYGHEQRHAQNCRSKAKEVADMLNASDSATYKACRSYAFAQKQAAKTVFFNWKKKEAAHNNPESPHGIDWEPIGTMPGSTYEW